MGEETATARTVTLGVVNKGSGAYSPGELDVVGGALEVGPTPQSGIVANPSLQVLSKSTLQIQDGGFVNLGTFVVENYGTIDIGTEGDGGTLTAGAVINRSSGVINGGLTFEAATGGTVINAGQISGLVFSGVTVGDGVLVFNGQGNITNSGTISGTNGIEFLDGGSVTNSANGKITGTW